MQLEKVRSYPTPKYPTAVQFHETEKLTRYMPRRWRSSRLVGQILLFTAITGLCSCSIRDTAPRETEPSGQTTVESDTENAKTPWYLQIFRGEERTETKPAGERPLTVPLFVHGEGRGSFGCDSVLPPVYLSEDEAAQVIRETAREYGVDFSGRSTVEGKKLPYTNVYGDDMNKTYKGELELDGYDSALGIGFEYVSQKDVDNWHLDTGVMTTVEIFDMKDTAEKLTAALTDTAVFYDPGIDYDAMPDWHNTEDWAAAVEEYQTIQKERMFADLRAQVVDFLEWLAGQGVI